jgi:hypothetical protein
MDINHIFKVCCDIITYIGEQVGLSYEAVNIWLFVVIQPLLILLFMTGVNYSTH